MLKGKYEFFEQFKSKIIEDYEDQKEEIEVKQKFQEALNCDYQKKLFINVGYYNSYKALRTARNIPNTTQREFLAIKTRIDRDRKIVR